MSQLVLQDDLSYRKYIFFKSFILLLGTNANHMP